MVDPKLPAFPAESTVIPLSHNGGMTYYKGMDLRTYIATHALQGLLTRQHSASFTQKCITAVKYADGLIEALNEK